jgi:hypothetical protein
VNDAFRLGFDEIVMLLVTEGAIRAELEKISEGQPQSTNRSDRQESASP